MMNAQERAARTEQARTAKNAAILAELEGLMDAAMENGKHTITIRGYLDEDVVKVLKDAGYGVHFNSYHGNTIAW